MVRSSSDLLAALAQLGNDDFDALLVDRAQTVAGHAQAHPALFARHPEAAFVKVRQPAAPRLVVGVGNIVSGKRSLSGDLADSGHCEPRRFRFSVLSQDGSGPAAAMRHAVLEVWPNDAG